MSRSATNAPPHWQSVPPAVVYSIIANATVGDEADADRNSRAFGEITLHKHQQDAVQRLRAAIAEFGGALLADTVGLGKTYVALAVASTYDSVHIIAPANLLPMWRSAIANTGAARRQAPGTQASRTQAADVRRPQMQAARIQLHSLHALSRHPIDHRTVSHTSPDTGNDAHEIPQNSIVIIDEAHHLRTRNTARYRNAAQFTTGRQVLLLSATPLHNRKRDLANLLAFFLGNRTDSLDDRVLAKCIIRRTTLNTPHIVLPSVVEHPAFALTDNPPVLESILMLPTPVPTNDGTAAGALVRLGLLRAWCSSDAALSSTIRRRELRGEALLHSLAHGRYPTQRELQSWILGTDSIQLGFPELLVASATHDSASMIAALSRHLDALHALLQLHTRSAVADPERAAMLRTLLRSREPAGSALSASSPVQSATIAAPIIAFSQFASTVRALYRALSDLAGIASLTSEGGQIAGGAIGRHELIARFAPRAHGRPPPPLHEQIRLLLTTDLLAEGVNLQDAATLVHLDFPWTDAARAQRVGRLVRIGSPHDVIHVHTIAPPAGAERTLRIVETLRRKAMLSNTTVGAALDFADASAAATETAAESATRLREKMLQWKAQFTAHPHSFPISPHTLLASVSAARSGWIAVVEYGSFNTVLAATSIHDFEPSGNVSDSAICVMRAVDDIREVAIDVSSAQIIPSVTRLAESITSAANKAQAEINSWYSTLELQKLTGESRRSLSASQKHALQHLTERLNGVQAVHRNAFSARATIVTETIVRSRGSGVDALLDLWIAKGKTLAMSEWLSCFPIRVACGFESMQPTSRPSAEFRVRALLLLSASSDNADAPPHNTST